MKNLELITVATTVGTKIQGSQHSPSVLLKHLQKCKVFAEKVLEVYDLIHSSFNPEKTFASNSERDLYLICEALQKKKSKRV